jgi:hypothetical protein
MAPVVEAPGNPAEYGSWLDTKGSLHFTEGGRKGTVSPSGFKSAQPICMSKDGGGSTRLRYCEYGTPGDNDPEWRDLWKTWFQHWSQLSGSGRETVLSNQLSGTVES